MRPAAARPRAAARRLGRAALPAALATLLVALLLAACVTQPSPTPIPTPTPSTTPEPSPTVSSTAVASASPTATPAPPLSLDVPEVRDRHHVAVTVANEVPPNGDGRIVVTVTNLSAGRIGELVLRWPTELEQTLFLAPFEPSVQRIADGGPPLWQEWTKWVEGPGERGEPAGTTSLGWGPLLPNGTLTIPIVVTRNARGEVAFDLQLLADEAILTLEGGDPAELRVSIP
jgi:hypothetical protein